MFNLGLSQATALVQSLDGQTVGGAMTVRHEALLAILEVQNLSAKATMPDALGPKPAVIGSNASFGAPRPSVGSAFLTSEKWTFSDVRVSSRR